MTSFFIGTDLFNTNNISIRELNKFNYLKDPLNLRFNQSNVKLNPKNTNNNEFFNDYIIKKLDPIPNSNSKQKIAPSNYYLDLIDISHKSNNKNNKQDSHESRMLNDKDLNGALGSIPLDKIVLENTMLVEKNLVNVSNSECIARKLQADENVNSIDSIMSIDVLNSHLESNYQKRLDIALQKIKTIPMKTSKSSSSVEHESIEENFIETEDVVDDFIESEKHRYRQMKKNRKLSLDAELIDMKQRAKEIKNTISIKSASKGKHSNVSKEDNTIQMEDEQKRSIQMKTPKKDQLDKEIIYTLDSFDNSMPFSVRNDINIILNQLEDTEDNSFINELRNILFSTNQKNISPYERNKINQLYIKNRLNPIKNLIKVKLSVMRNLSSIIKSKVNVIDRDENSD